ncbi:MAG TPA: NAD-dependent epimerase/dehydratase family protein [Anaerolineaceae bacterium]
MKVLVTGGAGFIGSHVVDLLLKSGHEVVVVDNLSTGRKSNLNPNAKFYQVDIRSPELEKVFEAEHPEVVDHHAAQMDVRRSVADPIYDADINVLGGLNLLNLAVKYKTRKVIHISSGGAVYGEPVYVPCDEKHPVQPLCPYGATKYMLELYLYMYKETYGLDFSVIRYPNVYGPRQDPSGEAGVVAIFSGLMLKSEPLKIYGTGEQVRDYVFVKDCARANLLLLDKGSGGVFNLGYGIGTTVNQIYHELKKITNYPLDAIYAPARAGETFRIYLDATRASKELGWEPTVPLADGLRQTVEYFREVEVHA